MVLMQPKPVTQKEIEKYALGALKRWLKKAMILPEVKKRMIPNESSTYQVDLSICSSSRMAQLNGAFRKKSEPTDILSFPTDEFFQRQGVLGDLVLCGPVAIRQAREIGHPWKREVDVLLVHGILHLLSYDHEASEKEAIEMGRMERKILASGAAGKKAKSEGLVGRSTPPVSRRVKRRTA
jgi:rRNA maturation RNase YbeY